MFSPRALDDDIEAVRDQYAPGSPVLDVESDFETLPPAAAEDLGLFVDALDPASYPAEWLPEAVPDLLGKHAGPAFTVGLPGDGTVVRTAQTDPPAVLVKRRAEGTPEDFLAFLVAERLVQIDCDPAPGAVSGGDSTGLPETFLPFFGERYRDLDAAIRRPDPETGASTTGFGPADVFQVANALFDAWVGLHTRDTLASWESEHPRLYDAWVDAGKRLSGRLGELSGEVARGDTEFPSATEYACSAVKHDLDLPAPYAALDTTAYRDRGAAYAVAWTEKTFAALLDES
ncbi:hypothetical protein EXE41_16060 [Halorubrum sp. SD690R]|uniref:DUF7089 family protein n=1 Tax=unclassified Halorubrum TaxID=2642239 RepID=UPI000A2D6581|nr:MULTISPECIES: hypothetical protein [unclassified Halorubrum]OTF06381.1 hypothetical protein B9G38_11595 [Halorubrum sp. SD612]TKX43091.1 hypothetical protein EXE41_16060 [Halorubrum sp. SD690R]